MSTRLARWTALLVVLLVSAIARADAGAPHASRGMHPVIVPRGDDAAPASSPEQVSEAATCGACHDVAFIRGTPTHAAAHRDVSCLGCHLDGAPPWGEPGALAGVDMALQVPRAASCAPCHGVVLGPEAPVLIPSAWAQALGLGRTTSLTLGEGAIVSAQPVQQSFLNLVGKAELSTPWDVHAAKLVDCVACHHAANDPSSHDPKRAALSSLAFDPRRLDLGVYLERPDHRLAKEGCRSCHDASKAHAFLPYRARHMERLACQTCHLSEALAPLAMSIDESVRSPAGQPVVQLRNRAGADNGSLVTRFQPLLSPRREADGVERLCPLNLVMRYRFVAEGRPVPEPLLTQAYLEAGDYTPEVRALFDADHDGALDERELRLDSEPKVALIRARLVALGVREPALSSEIEVHVLSHGVPTKERALRRCEACHGSSAHFATQLPLASYVPIGVVPALPRPDGRELAGELLREGQGLSFKSAGLRAAGDLYVLGISRSALSNRIGFGLFVLVALALLAHALTRVVFYLRQPAPPHGPTREDRPREYVFGRYERFWHWTMASSGIVLIVTGIVIHAGAAPGSTLREVVRWHNAAAVVLMLNAFLGFFYHGATAALRNFIPDSKGLLGRMLEHVDYQTRGIFYGGPHPRNAPGAKLNPLQQLTYLALLNFLFPLQIVTGLLMWAEGTWPALSVQIGALAQVAPLHNFGSWLFLTFFVLHVYLVTTGSTVGEHLQTMVTGYRDLESSREDPEQVTAQPSDERGS